MKTDITNKTELEQLARKHSKDREQLNERATDLQMEIAALKRRRLPGLRSALAQAADSRSAIVRHIEEHPDAIPGKAKTITICGIRIGHRKDKGKLIIPDVDKAVIAIRRQFKGEADQFLNTKVSPDRNALKDLPASTLAKLGLTLTEPTDKPHVGYPADDVDKLVDQLLEDDNA